LRSGLRPFSGRWHRPENGRSRRILLPDPGCVARFTGGNPLMSRLAQKVLRYRLSVGL